MKQVVFGFVAAVVVAVVGFVGYVAYQDHKVVKAIEVFASEVGKTGDGQSITAADILAQLTNERIQLIKGQQAMAKASAEEAQKK